MSKKPFRPYNKIFNIGLSRTGTFSLCYFFRTEGVDCIHYPDPNYLMSKQFTQTAACDITVTANYKKLAKLYPNSRFIHTVREKSSWMESMERYMDPKRYHKHMTGWRKDIRLQMYGSMFFDEAAYSDAYDRHYEDVENFFRNNPASLYTLNIVEGEDPAGLCDYLQIDRVTSGPFPRQNEFLRSKK